MPEFWHLLSLDAPTVAVLWAWAFAHAAGVRLHATSLSPLGLATWLLYVADRLLDRLQDSRAQPLRERHHFHWRHRGAFLIAAVPASALLFWLVTVKMAAAPRVEDLLLSGAAILYFLCVHVPAFKNTHLLPMRKELAVAIIFAAACAIPAWSRQPSAHRPLLAAGILFAGLCYLNCMAIDRWEREPVKDQPRETTRVDYSVRVTCLGVCFGGVAGAVAAAFAKTPLYAEPALCVTASACLLLLLERNRSRMTPLLVRAAADAALLTPAIFVLGRMTRW